MASSASAPASSHHRASRARSGASWPGPFGVGQVWRVGGEASQPAIACIFSYNMSSRRNEISRRASCHNRFFGERGNLSLGEGEIRRRRARLVTRRRPRPITWRRGAGRLAVAGARPVIYSSVAAPKKIGERGRALRPGTSYNMKLRCAIN